MGEQADRFYMTVPTGPVRLVIVFNEKNLVFRLRRWQIRDPAFGAVFRTASFPA